MSSENFILCYPDQDGDPEVSVFGYLPPEWLQPLLAKFNKYWPHGSTSSHYPKDLHHVRCPYLFSKNLGHDEEERVGEASWLRSHIYLSPSHGTIDLGEQVEHRYESIWRFDGDLSRELEALMLEHGFEWRWAGWDEEPRFVARGIVRAAPGVVRKYEGDYVISPRCHVCGGKTGWCQCFDELEEAVKALAEKHTCDGCYYKLWLERIEAEWREHGRILDRDVLDWLKHEAEDLPRSVEWAQGEGDSPEYLAEKKAKLEDLRTLPAIEFVRRHSDDFIDWWQECISEGDSDESYCECPLEGD